MSTRYVGDLPSYAHKLELLMKGSLHLGDDAWSYDISCDSKEHELLGMQPASQR